MSKPDVVDAAEVAQRLNVSLHTVHTWRQRGVMPAVDFDLRVGPLWLWDTVQSWAIATKRLDVDDALTNPYLGEKVRCSRCTHRTSYTQLISGECSRHKAGREELALCMQWEYAHREKCARCAEPIARNEESSTPAFVHTIKSQKTRDHVATKSHKS